MEFKLNFTIPQNPVPLNISDKILLTGSCFAENIGNYLNRYKFQSLVNPNGILFNPKSIFNSFADLLNDEAIDEKQLLEYDQLHHSWMHHGSFSSTTRELLMEKITASKKLAQAFLKEAKWLIITFGTAHVFELEETGIVVANCHKVPQNKFRKKLLQPGDIINDYNGLLKELRGRYPDLKIIFTVSPVRYLREGLIANNLSKAVLLRATHELVAQNSHCFYFPAYEIVMDELRDYRFFKEDFTHPNELAIAYVWERFAETFFDDQTKNILKEIKELITAYEHRAVQPESNAHKKFKDSYYKKCMMLSKNNPQLDLEKELAYFGG